MAGKDRLGSLDQKFKVEPNRDFVESRARKIVVTMKWKLYELSVKVCWIEQGWSYH